MLLKHFFLGKIAHSSYLLAGKETCAIIDPQRDIHLYLQEARNLGVKITHILQTHLHADFVSGHMDLAAATGAKIYVPASANCTFDHVPLKEGDLIKIEDMHLLVLETPGHTPEHISYVVTDTSRGKTPIGVFVGDTLFVGDVGRPDLFPDKAQELAEKLFHSLHDKLLKLPDYVEVYPAHGAGSLCGRSMGAKWLSTIGYERLYNPALQIQEKPAFINSLTTDMPPAPDHFSRCSDINRHGPTTISRLPALQELSIEKFMEIYEQDKVLVLDVRSYASFASLHIPGSWHIDLNGNFPTFAGWVLPVDKDILLIADSFTDATNANLWARRVGVDRVIGYLNGGLNGWVTKGKASDEILLLSAENLHDRILGDHNFVLVDVRSPLEYAESHIEGAVNIPTPDLRYRYEELDPQKPTILICSSGNRSSLAGSILKQRGFKHVYHVAGGMTGYSVAGYTKACKVCVNPHGSRFTAGTYINIS
jgi:glyoxylase-like metal-dependent hydrolase (beta-lactamase superfamily II)/rhodanese-related sulfurtransferase